MFTRSCSKIPDGGARSSRGIFLVLILCTLIFSASAGYLSELEINEQSGRYRVKVVMLLHAPANYVHNVLTDYVHIYRLNPSITESGILPSPVTGTIRVKTRVEGCLFIFCRDFDRVEEVREVTTGHLQAVIVPELSDFSSGRADWFIRPEGYDSEVVYESQFTPAFFIPPIIGSYFVRQTLGESIMTSFARIECIARIKAGLTSRPGQYLADATPGAVDAHELKKAILAGEDPTNRGNATAAGGYNRSDGACYQTCEQPASGC
jgi:hypothetical protein